MQLSNAPSQLVLPFANSGQRNVIPVPSQIPITPGAASFTDGFPPLTMVAPSGGGVPPAGKDFNGIFYDLSAIDVWMSLGGGFPWSSVVSSAVGGYPNGARVLKAAGIGYWLSTADNNVTNPDTGGAGWVPDGAGGAVSSVYASAQHQLAVGNSKVMYDTVEFDNTGQWDAANQRWKALYAGNYRLSGSTYLAAPAGQVLTADIYKNGILAKRCFEAPQIGDYTVNLSFPFNAVIAMSANDYLEAYMNVPQTIVSVGVIGSNQAYVYSQFEYLGE